MGTPAQWYDNAPSQPQDATADLENRVANNKTAYLNWLDTRQQAQAQPQFPQPAMQQQQQQAPPANNAQNAGPVKTGLRHVLMGVLGAFSYGAGEAAMKAAGLETDNEKAMRLAIQQHMNAESSESNARAQLLGVQTQVEQRKQQMFQQFFQNQGLNDPSASLGPLAPHEQAQLEAARSESAIKGDLSPFYDAVRDITKMHAQHEGLPLSDLATNQLNAENSRRYQILHPGETLPDDYKLSSGATDKDYNRVHSALDDEEKALGLKQQHDFQNGLRQDQQNAQLGARRDARSDRNFQYNNTQLNNVAKPLADSLTRMGRLDETLRQGSPQADALVAPELLTIMAGGQGSGLRMNEAEISRIVGGRSNWQDLQAWAQKWNTDPTKANSLTPAQRTQVQSLVSAVEQKAQTKRGVIEDARQQLINADDPIAQRQIIANTHSKLNAIDAGNAPNFAAGANNSGTNWKSRSIPFGSPQ